ncbi:hypothetical protein B5G16_06500 [Alistipes sp. An66]|nr:hypothetical protein B5G16_06500 [Alistipes sp. An66]
MSWADTLHTAAATTNNKRNSFFMTVGFFICFPAPTKRLDKKQKSVEPFARPDRRLMQAENRRNRISQPHTMLRLEPSKFLRFPSRTKAKHFHQKQFCRTPDKTKI